MEGWRQWTKTIVSITNFTFFACADEIWRLFRNCLREELTRCSKSTSSRVFSTEQNTLELYNCRSDMRLKANTSETKGPFTSCILKMFSSHDLLTIPPNIYYPTKNIHLIKARLGNLGSADWELHGRAASCSKKDNECRNIAGTTFTRYPIRQWQNKYFLADK